MEHSGRNKNRWGRLHPAPQIAPEDDRRFRPVPKWTFRIFIISHFAPTHRMTNSQRLALVRACLVQWLADRREPGESSAGSEHPILGESVLIRNEFYCGRRFHTAEHQAVWFIEEDELKIYRNSGELESVLTGEEIGNRAATLGELQEQPQPSPGAEQPTPPAVIKMPAPAESSEETDDESENELPRAA